MKPEAQRIAIAEACGWKAWDHPDVKSVTWKWLYPGDHVMSPKGRIVPFDDIPDYLHDLNAMHEMEKTLTKSQRVAYEGTLTAMWWACAQKGGETSSWMHIHATAAQRAEAFLRTLNLWKDETNE